jgi:hypothetical protein
VLCSHGDVIGALLDHFKQSGVPVEGDAFEKGSTWALEIDAGAVVSARYLAPPA